MSLKKIKATHGVSALILFPMFTASAFATVLEEITVTAQKREQSIQDVGISITAWSGEQLSDLGITNSEDLMNMVPGLVIGTFGSQATTTPTVRGVSQNDFADHNEPPIAIYADGAYISFIGGAGFNLFDVERVEVARGPQGTLFGRNATGGLIHIISNRPTKEFEAYTDLSLGEYELVEFEGAASGALNEQLLGRLSIATRNHEGYIDNTIGRDLQESDNVSGRLQLEFLPSEDLNILLKLHGSQDDVKGSVGYVTPRAIYSFTDPTGLVFNPSNAEQFATFCTGLFDANVPEVPIAVSATSTCSGFESPAIGDPYKTAVDYPGIMDRETYGVTGTIRWDISDSLTLTSISDYLSLDRDYSEDTDGTSFRLFNFYSFVDSYQLSQEVRLNGESDRIRWVTGLYYLTIDNDIVTGIDAAADSNTLENANPDVLFPFLTRNAVAQETDSWAIFAQGEYEITPAWTIIGGLRYSEDNKDIGINPACDPASDIFGFTCSVLAPPGTIQGDGFTGSQSAEDFSAKIGLDWRPNDDWLLFAGVTRGQKGGGFNAGAISGVSLAAAVYDPEVLVNYEAGFKSTLFGGKARFNGSFFYYDYSDYQAFTLTGVTPTVFNTDAEMQGFELELAANPWAGLDVVLGLSYLDAEAKDVPNNLLPGAINLGKQVTPQSPEWSFNGLLRYQWPILNGSVAVQGDMVYIDERAFNTVNHPALLDDSYTLVNARLSYTTQDDQWTFAIWVKNLTGTEYTSFAFDFSGSDGTAPGTVNPPRWAGGTISYRWN